MNGTGPLARLSLVLLWWTTYQTYSQRIVHNRVNDLRCFIWKENWYWIILYRVPHLSICSHIDLHCCVVQVLQSFLKLNDNKDDAKHHFKLYLTLTPKMTSSLMTPTCIFCSLHGPTWFMLLFVHSFVPLSMFKCSPKNRSVFISKSFWWSG